MQFAATWWGYTEGHPALVTAAVGILAVAAVGLVVRRVLRGWRR